MKAKELIEKIKKNPEMELFIQDGLNDCLEVNSFGIVNLSDLQLDDSDVIFTKDYSSTTKLNKSYKVFERYDVDLYGDITPIQKEDYVYVKDVLVIGCQRNIEKKECNNKELEEKYKEQEKEKKFIKANQKDWNKFNELKKKFKV